MRMNNIHDLFTLEELQKVDKLASLCGTLKKKRDESKMGFLASSLVRHFRFFYHGRFLAYYNEAPTYKDEPKNIVAVTEIESVEADYKGKSKNFLLTFKQGKKLHLKCDDEEVVKLWISTINKLKEIYMDKPLTLIDSSRQWKEKADIRVRQLIVEELEST